MPPNSKATKLLSASDINHSSFFLFFALGNLICLTVLVEGALSRTLEQIFPIRRQNGIFPQWESFSGFLDFDVLVPNYVFLFTYLLNEGLKFCF